ncbi:TBC1 domain family member 4 isoform X3 [Scleropages formosus]|uniref:TBC1 domain family member 4 isoform X3 n=1 Tax=Scleropages formosus TaxID=113540 RepID=UPI0010FA6CA6|nr:TBC1 domain family member 4 isoform X3 [Scleropages formosus]
MEVRSAQDGAQDGAPPGSHEKRFIVRYLGWAPLDRRTTLPMLPWLVAEIRRKGERGDGAGHAHAREVQLRLAPPLLRCVPADSAGASVFVFEHHAHAISRFVHNSHDVCCFAYLMRNRPDDPESEMACHVFRAREPGQVPDIISSIRQVSKAALKEDVWPKQETEDAFYNSQKFEVLYCGKVTVAHKRAPSTIIDDCIEKFQQYEVERRRPPLVNDVPPELLPADRDPLSAIVGGWEPESLDVEEAADVVLRSSSLRGSLPECILEDSSGFEEQQEFRTRCGSLAAGLRQRSREAASGQAPSRRRHASAPSHVQPTDAEKNRTMLFQVGRFEVNLISPDSKTVVLEKNFKDISSCSQGIKHTDHFGLICRDAAESGRSQYVCYVFQCANESLVDEVMLTLKQAFGTAAALRSSRTQVKLCEACPMHDLHKLCERIEGLYPPRAKLAIQTYLSQLTDSEQVDIFERVQKIKPASDQEENELVILHLRQLCEAKQKTHLHIGEAPQNAHNNIAPESSTSTGRFKLDILKNKARSSLTSSLENIFSRGASRMRGRLGSMGSFERQDDSPGDSPPGTPPSSSLCLSEEDPSAVPFRRRAHTFSHPPVKKRISFDSHGTKGPLWRQQSVAPELLQSSNGEGRKRTLSGCSTDSLSGAAVPCSPRRISWRQKIFLQVASPLSKAPGSMHRPDSLDARELLPLSPRASAQEQDPLDCLLGLSPGEKVRRTSVDYRTLWKKAIHQQILLLRMEKENQRLEASRDELHIRKMKLDYQEVGQCSKEAQDAWEKKLSVPGRSTIQCDMEEIHMALCQGVPKGRRGEVWHLLSQQHRLRHRLPCKQQPPDTSYQDLLKQLTAQQHAILVDLGRTFPTHPYFSAQLGAGQLSLYNLLKAYSLLDTEVGYCQGISFVAGVLLLHMSEEQAFEMLKFLMYDMGFRRQYRPDMVSLQIQMYQLSRLLHDYHRELYSHLEQHEVCPSLYAAPWFLTLFASQFPLGFVARVFDFLFVQGTEVIFKVALGLLRGHEGEIMECDSFETIVDYLKTTIPTLTQGQMEQTISQVLEMDISKQLQAYEVEYHVLQDEVLDTSSLLDDSDRLDKLEKTNTQLKKQNMDLLEKLQAARVKIQSLEVNMENFLLRENKMKQLIRSLEQEKASYQKTIERMRSSLPPGALCDIEMTHIKAGDKAGSTKP